MVMAIRKSEMRNGSVWPIPPAAVISPVTEPRSIGRPRPVSDPSSDSASAKAIEMPAPTDAARPTRNAVQLLLVANAAANTGARVETDPSIRPDHPVAWERPHHEHAGWPVRKSDAFRAPSPRPASGRHRCVEDGPARPGAAGGSP